METKIIKLPNGRIRKLIAKACPKCYQVYSLHYEKCPNEDCRGCYLVEVYGEAKEVNDVDRSNKPAQ